MTDSDRLKFEAYLAGVAEIFDVQLSDMKANLYFEALKDMDIEQINHACSYLIQTAKFFPKPSEIRQAINGNAQDQAIIALQQVKQAMESIGGYKSVSFEDKTIMAVIQALGGWQKLCETPYDEWRWLEKDFVKIYQAYSGKDVPAPEKLTGITEHHNVLRGYADHVPETVQIGTGNKAKVLRLGRTGC